MNSKDNKASASEKSPSESITVLVDDSGLSSLSRKLNLVQYIRSLWSRRHFILTFAKTNTYSNGRDRYLGNLWVILDPAFQVSVYALIFGLILKVDRGMDNFIGFLVLGVVFFKFFSTGINGGSNLIQQSRALITSFRFPRAAVAFSATTKQFINNLIPACLAVVAALSFQWSEPIHWTIILVVPLYILAHLFALGTTMVAARITAFIPDFQSIISVITRGLFFISGVFFDISRFDATPLLQKLVEANPIYQFLMAIRSCVLDGVVPTADTWGYLLAWSFGIFIFGFFYFYQAEERYSLVK